MKFDNKKKQTIIFYLLEKIARNAAGVSKIVSETFGISSTTVHAYINELTAQNIIRKVKRGQYELIQTETDYQLNRAEGDLDEDTFAFDRCLSRHLQDFPPNVREIWSYAFSEMINNVVDHSLAETAEIKILQDHLTTTVHIHDNGIGIFRKIKEHFGFSSLDEAICELFKGKLTTDSANHSGEGIFFSSKLMDDFYIVSDGKLFTNNKYDTSRITTMTGEHFSGTKVVMTLSNFSQKTSREVFDLYANIDGGFFKTTIPMKNIFESSPVSRSQAKRICNRLEIFKEVIIDFDGIGWMGQGFAHQLFIVFAGNHPDIRLTPVNMNEDVTKMFIHVTATAAKQP